jgi:hypothetical protein
MTMLTRFSRLWVLGLMLASPAMLQAAGWAVRAACPASCTDCAHCPFC